MAGKNTSTPAAATPAAREPVTVRGLELLALIAAAGEAGLMLTQAEGLDAVNAGHATVDTSVVDGETAKVTLTDAGRAALEASQRGATSGASSFEIEDGVAMPTEAKRRGRSGGYPFDMLNVGQSFHVAPGKDDKDANAVVARLQSSVSGARAKYAEPTGEMETVTVKTYKKGDGGKFLKDADGKRVIESETPTQRAKTKVTRDFKVAAVGENDPKGVGARVWRIA